MLPDNSSQQDGSPRMTQPTFEADGIRIRRVDNGRSVIYQVSGEVDTLTAPHVDSALHGLDATSVDQVILDLTDVPFLSSSGLSILALHHDRCRRQDITFAVVAAHHATLRAIQITALDRIIPLYHTASDALAAGTPTAEQH
jgi:anti-sigma B factor antagonist